MNALEFAISERNRLVWLSITTSVLGFAFAVAARDPFLNINLPFTGTEVGNITAGHVVLLGHPLLCLLYLLLCSQIYRYHGLILTSCVTDNARRHLDWRLVSNFEGSMLARSLQTLSECFRWFALLVVPLIASVILYESQFHFYYSPLEASDNRLRIYDNRHYCDKKWKKIDLEYIFRNNFQTIVASYLKLRRNQCEYSEETNTNPSDFKRSSNDNVDVIECEEREKLRKKLLARLPLLYQPLNYLISTAFQVPVVIIFVVLSFHFFRAEHLGHSLRRYFASKTHGS